MKKSILFSYLLLISITCFSQQITVRGKISDANGTGIPSVSILEKGTNNGTTTNSTGEYSFTVKPNSTLVISSVGYGATEIAVNGQTTVNATLTGASTNLSDVVVVAYGTQSRTTLTSSQTSINAESFKGQQVTRLDQALQGRATGVQVTNSSGAPGSDVRIRIRGANSINGGNDPLYVIDGYVGGDFNTINHAKFL